MRDFDTAQFSIQQACAVAGLNVSTGRSWFQKGWLSLWVSDAKAKTAGATTVISARSVLALSIAARLVSIGGHPQHSCTAARHFTDRGDVRNDGRSRNPGDLYAGVRTALVAYPSGSAAVLPVLPGGLEAVFFPEFADAPDGRQEGAILLLLDFVVKHVEIELLSLTQA